MPGLIYYDEIKQAMFPHIDDEARKRIRLSSVERALRRRGLPFEYGENGVFAMQDAWMKKLSGELIKPDDDPIEF